MGDFRITVNAVGGHGCQRDAKDGDKVSGCGSMRCPDCITAKYIADLARSGAMLKDAKIQHWPEQPSEVVDAFDVTPTSPPLAVTCMATRTRRGSF